MGVRERTHSKRKNSKPQRKMKIPLVLLVACVASLKAASLMDSVFDDTCQAVCCSASTTTGGETTTAAAGETTTAAETTAAPAAADTTTTAAADTTTTAAADTTTTAGAGETTTTACDCAAFDCDGDSGAGSATMSL